MKKINQIGKYTTESIHKHTGKHWHEWMSILDKNGARHLEHKEIVQFLKTKYKLGSWWQQGVTYGYEIFIGKRVEGQNLKGDYSVTLTKSLNYDPKKLWKWLCSSEGIQVWLEPMSEFTIAKNEHFELLGEIFGEVRTLQAPQRVRISWQNSDWPKKTTVQILVIPKPQKKCMLVIQHENLSSAKIKEEMRTFWRERIDRAVTAISASNDLSRTVKSKPKPGR